MHSVRFPLVLLTAALLAGCSSTPESRIAQHQAAYDSFPPGVQERVRRGEVDVGYTQEMVLVALGEPTRQFSRQAESGMNEIWVYHDNGPRFSFGVGVGSVGRHSATSVGVGTSTGGYDPEEKMRVEFRDGRVTAVEYRR